MLASSLQKVPSDSERDRPPKETDAKPKKILGRDHGSRFATSLVPPRERSGKRETVGDSYHWSPLGTSLHKEGPLPRRS